MSKYISAKHLHRDLQMLTFGGQWRVAAWLEGSMCAWAGVRGGKSSIWLAMGMEKAATDRSKRRDLMILAVMGSYLNTWVLPDYPRGTHQSINLYIWSILVPPS